MLIPFIKYPVWYLTLFQKSCTPRAFQLNLHVSITSSCNNISEVLTCLELFFQKNFDLTGLHSFPIYYQQPF